MLYSRHCIGGNAGNFLWGGEGGVNAFLNFEILWQMAIREWPSTKLVEYESLRVSNGQVESSRLKNGQV